MKKLIASLKRIAKADPISFWSSMIGAVTGSVALVLMLMR